MKTNYKVVYVKRDEGKMVNGDAGIEVLKPLYKKIQPWLDNSIKKMSEPFELAKMYLPSWRI